MAAVELPRLASRLWSSPPAATDLSGTLSASFEASGDLANPDSVNTAIAIAPLDAVAYGVPLRAPAGLRATWSNGRATLDDCQVTLGALAIRAGGDLPVGAPSAAASLEIDGDLGSLAPWLARLDEDQPWTLAGRVKGALGATRTPAGVALTGSLAATVDSLTRSERVLARQARLSVELTDSRAVVRDFTGHLLGGDVQGAFDAPLTWLNAALPERLWIRPPPTDAPATASLKGTLDVAAALEEFAPGRSRPVSGRICPRRRPVGTTAGPGVDRRRPAPRSGGADVGQHDAVTGGNDALPIRRRTGPRRRVPLERSGFRLHRPGRDRPGIGCAHAGAGRDRRGRQRAGGLPERPRRREGERHGRHRRHHGGLDRHG